MRGVLKLLDGWKLLIGVVLLFFASLWDQMTGDGTGHARGIVTAVLSVFGWMPSGFDVGQAVASAVVLIGFLDKLRKAHKQANAGATTGELLSTEGYVKEARADHMIPPGTPITSPDVPAASAPGLPPLAR